MKPILVLVLLASLLLAGCAELPFNLTGANPIPADPSPPAYPVGSTSAPAGLVTPTPGEAAATATPGPVVLRLWTPPQFDPNADTPAGRLLHRRLDDFQQRHPETRIEVRVKAVDGPGGLYEALSTTTAAAQLAMPDLVALPHPLIQLAATKGLLRPMNGLTRVMEDPDWYSFAHELASLQNSLFGLPFAGDLMIQTYHSADQTQPRRDWQAVKDAQSALAFPAADPQALFTLAMYQAAGGKLTDEQGRSRLDLGPLQKVLGFYQEAVQLEAMPAWLTQFQTDEQAWEAFRDGRAGALATWLSRFSQEAVEEASFAQLPTPAGLPFSLASGWAWTLTSPDPQRRQLAVELAEFLTESSFLGDWSEAAGVLPPRPSSLEDWQESASVTTLGPIASAAKLYPATDALASLGPALQEAVIRVLKGEMDPQAAALAAVNRLILP